MKIYLNGSYVNDEDPILKYNDRGFLLGDGIFETMRVYEGNVFCLEDHYTRLKKSANDLEIPLAMTLKDFKNIINNLLKVNDLSSKNASLRITLTRGPGPRGIVPSMNLNPTIMAVASLISPLSDANTYKLIVSKKTRRNENSVLSRIKSLCYLENILAKMEATKIGADDSIILNSKGYIACASVANIFIINEKGVITPRLEDGVLPGITRKIVIDICRSNNISVFEESITESDLMKAKEVFLTNQLIEIQAVVQVNFKLINDGKIGKTVLMLKDFYKNKILSSFNSIMRRALA